nr:O-antigen ligase family protein [uncultured Desulfobacter sp.]
MGKLILVLLIASTGCTTLRKPWIGIIAYYLLAILGPQYIWWWNFEGLRVSLIVALSTLSGIGISLFTTEKDYHFLLNRQNLWPALLWFFIVFSYHSGPYVSYFSHSGLSPTDLLHLSNTVFIFYFCASLEINQINKLHYLIIVFVVSTLYLTYWANDQYLSQNWSQFNLGRLRGPIGSTGSIYGDENAFAMVFVTGGPFVYYLGWQVKRLWLRWGLWATIPLSWHAVFLTGSRGGLLGIASVLLCVLLLSKKKIMAIPLLTFFLLFYQWQAGNVMDDRSQMISDYQGDKSAEDRLMAWSCGFRMVQAHPLTGVGLGSFVSAMTSFGGSRPMVAHNTFVQYVAESGIGAGFAYIAIILGFYLRSKKIWYWCKFFPEDEEKRKIDLYSRASTASFTGMVTCSLFLSLNNYEIFFVLLLFNNALYQICLKKSYNMMKVKN